MHFVIVVQDAHAYRVLNNPSPLTENTSLYVTFQAQATISFGMSLARTCAVYGSESKERLMEDVQDVGGAVLTDSLFSAERTMLARAVPHVLAETFIERTQDTGIVPCIVSGTSDQKDLLVYFNRDQENIVRHYIGEFMNEETNAENFTYPLR